LFLSKTRQCPHSPVLAKQLTKAHIETARILGCLCSNHIFRQTGPELFANNRISAALVHNDEFRAYIMAL
jgi:hypothetical protein